MSNENRNINIISKIEEPNYNTDNTVYDDSLIFNEGVKKIRLQLWLKNMRFYSMIVGFFVILLVVIITVAVLCTQNNNNHLRKLFLM